MTSTFTHTYTKTRIQVVLGEYRYLLLRAGLNDAHVESLLEGVKRRMVSSVILFATDASGKTRAEVELRIDWGKHDGHIAAGTVTVALDREMWKEDVSPDVRVAVGAFRECVTEDGLDLGVDVHLAGDISADPLRRAEADRLMNLVDPDPRPWTSRPSTFGGEIDEVPELRVDTRLADPE